MYLTGQQNTSSQNLPATCAMPAFSPGLIGMSKDALLFVLTVLSVSDRFILLRVFLMAEF